MIKIFLILFTGQLLAQTNYKISNHPNTEFWDSVYGDWNSVNDIMRLNFPYISLSNDEIRKRSLTLLKSQVDFKKTCTELSIPTCPFLEKYNYLVHPLYESPSQTSKVRGYWFEVQSKSAPLTEVEHLGKQVVVIDNKVLEKIFLDG